MKYFLITYRFKNFKKNVASVGGVITASKRVYLMHKKLKYFQKCYFYDSKESSFKIFRLINDMFNMIRMTSNNQVIYCLGDHSSLIRTVIYLLYIRFIFKKTKFIFDIRGGGGNSKLENKFKLNFNYILLYITYLLSDRIVLQTPLFNNVPRIFKKKIYFLPNTINTIENKKSSNNLLSQKFFKLIYSGRITENKGFHVYIELIEKYLNSEYLFIFAGDINLESKNKILFHNLISQKKIIFTGPLNPEELHRLIQKCDLFLHISKHETEGMPNSILDAVKCELPVLCNPIGFISDIFSKDHLNYTTDISADNIFKEIQLIKKNYNKYKSKSKSAYKYAQKHYSEKNYKQLLNKLYLSL